LPKLGNAELQLHPVGQNPFLHYKCYYEVMCDCFTGLRTSTLTVFLLSDCSLFALDWLKFQTMSNKYPSSGSEVGMAMLAKYGFSWQIAAPKQ
jgi:hypothetical protein